MRTDPPLVNRKPWIRRLDEDNAREGFIEEDQYRALLNELPEHLRALFVVGYHIGVRLGTLRKSWSGTRWISRALRSEFERNK